MRARVAPLLLAAATVLALAGGACSSGDSDTADPTLPTEPAVPTTTAPADPYAIPKVIDEAYVNRVLAALDQIDGDVLRRVVANGGIDAEVPKMLGAIYSGPQYDLELESLRNLLQRGLENFKSPPGNRKTTVTRLVAASPVCIFVEAATDFSEVLKLEPPDVPDEVELFTLRFMRDGEDASRLNATSWFIVNAEVTKRGDTPKPRATCDA